MTPTENWWRRRIIGRTHRRRTFSIWPRDASALTQGGLRRATTFERTAAITGELSIVATRRGTIVHGAFRGLKPHGYLHQAATRPTVQGAAEEFCPPALA